VGSLDEFKEVGFPLSSATTHNIQLGMKDLNDKSMINGWTQK
jgi:hypothetical protein